VPVEGSETYLTEHQREQLENFRQHHGQQGIWFHIQQRFQQMNESTGLLLQRARGDHGDFEPLSPFTSALRQRKVKAALVSRMVAG
jgi:hypothetical protein